MSEYFDNLLIETVKYIADELLNELESFKHKVILVPAPEPKHSCHKIRVRDEKNPDWFSKLNEGRGGNSSSKYRVERNRIIPILKQLKTTGRATRRNRNFYIVESVIKDRMIQYMKDINQINQSRKEEPF